LNAHKCICSNNGGDAITEKTLDHWKNGLPREQLQLFDMEQLLTLRAFNEKGELIVFIYTVFIFLLLCSKLKMLKYHYKNIATLTLTILSLTENLIVFTEKDT